MIWSIEFIYCYFSNRYIFQFYFNSGLSSNQSFYLPTNGIYLIKGFFIFYHIYSTESIYKFAIYFVSILVLQFSIKALLIKG